MLAAAGVAHAQDACRFVTVGTAMVRAANDTGIVLEDGRTVRLAGVDVPEPDRGALAAGTAVTLKRIGTVPETDRYGHVVAHVCQ